MQGPDMMNDLLEILIRFREGKVAIAADIEAMYHQVFVTPTDRDALRFLWWPQGDLNKAPKHYRMTVHLFGGVWSPACAAFALKKTLESSCSDVAKEAESNFYVDDLLLSTQSEDAAINQARELQILLKQGGFRLTKWISNSRNAISSISPTERNVAMRNVDISKESLPMDCALGVSWDLDSDTLKVRVSTPSKPCSRRGILSTMSSVYDPSGVLAPFTVRAKIIFQDEVRRNVGWDQNLTAENKLKWDKWLSELETLEGLAISRQYTPEGLKENEEVELHHFCDASQAAYASVSYLRVKGENGVAHSSMILARTRLAPIKTLSIP